MNSLQDETEVFVINHQPYSLDVKPPYVELHVGPSAQTRYDKTKNSFSFVSDNTGDNISYKNFAYSELTGLYWIWKNAKANILGLVHYRRFLKSPEASRPLNASEIVGLLEDSPIITAAPVSLPCSVASHYCKCHSAEDLRILYSIMDAQPTQYRQAFYKHMEGSTLIPYNMMITTVSLLKEYCSWLFPVLNELEQALNLFQGRDSYQMRVFGFIAERMLNVWIIAKNLSAAFCDVYDPQGDTKQIMKSFDVEAWPSYSKLLSPLERDDVFSSKIYLERNRDVYEHFNGDPEAAAWHYLTMGIDEDRSAAEIITLNDYKNLRPSLREQNLKGSDVYHRFNEEASSGNLFLTKNIVLGVTKKGHIDYAPVYDWLFYTSQYDDVPNNPNETSKALEHFIEVGIAEGRQGSKGFKISKYKSQHPLLTKLLRGSNKALILFYVLVEAKNKYAFKWEYVN